MQQAYVTDKAERFPQLYCDLNRNVKTKINKNMNKTDNK
jgi:hypothetical protein